MEAEEEEVVEEAGGEAKVEAEAEEQEQEHNGPTLNFGDVLFGER